MLWHQRRGTGNCNQARAMSRVRMCGDPWQQHVQAMGKKIWVLLVLASGAGEGGHRVAGDLSGVGPVLARNWCRNVLSSALSAGSRGEGWHGHLSMYEEDLPEVVAQNEACSGEFGGLLGIGDRYWRWSTTVKRALGEKCFPGTGVDCTVC